MTIETEREERIEDEWVAARLAQLDAPREPRRITTSSGESWWHMPYEIDEPKLPYFPGMRGYKGK